MAAVVPTWKFEESIVAEGGEWIIGLDEVGRGCLAGPVTLGAAAFRRSAVGTDNIPEGLKDSKLLSKKKREALISPIQDWADAVATGSCSNQLIDEKGISYCLGLAAVRAIDAVQRTLMQDYPSEFIPRSKVAVILDGPHDYISPVIGAYDSPSLPVIPRIYTRVKADQQCASVAAASVYAKVARDQEMVHLAQENPQWDAYQWARNKGYGSAAHRAAIKELGPTPYHRVSWHLV